MKKVLIITGLSVLYVISMFLWGRYNRVRGVDDILRTPAKIAAITGIQNNKFVLDGVNCYFFGKYGTSCSDVVVASYNYILQNYKPTVILQPAPKFYPTITDCRWIGSTFSCFSF